MSVALIFLFLMLFSIVLFLLSVFDEGSVLMKFVFRLWEKENLFFESETLKMCQNFAYQAERLTTLKKDGQVYALSE